MRSPKVTTPMLEPLSYSWRDFLSLTKPTITLLVVVTAIPNLLISGSKTPGSITFLSCIIGTALASASAAIFNQIVETKTDSKMQRTRNRLLASGKIPRSLAIFFATLIGLLAFFLLYWFTTPLSAAIAFFGHCFYVLGYTLYLKPRTPQNIVIGGAAGAVGPLIGCAAVTGSLDTLSILLFLLITLWTPPHFWSLALKYKEDYAQANIPMYPVVHGDEKTRLWIMIYTLSLLPIVFLIFWLCPLGWLYLSLSMMMTLKFVIDAVRIYINHSNEHVMPFFHYSCFYTFGIFSTIVLDWMT